MTVVSLLNIGNPATNPLSAKNLGNDLTALASAGLTAQVNALVLERQQRVDPFNTDPLLSTTLQYQQDQMRRSASYVLSRLMRDMIQNIADASAATALVSALRSTLSQQQATFSTGPKAAAQLIDATAKEFTTYHQDASDLAQALEREVQNVQASQAQITTLIEKRVQGLDGPDGSIAKTIAGIDTTKTAIETDLQNLVKSASDIGAAVKQLVTGVLTTFDLANTPDKPADDKDKKADPEAKDKAADKTRPAITPKEAREAGDNAFPVESVGAITDGTSGVSAAVQSFKNNNAQLANLYQQLAQQQATLAIATAVGVQINAYAAALRTMAAMAGNVEKSWAEITAGYESVAETLQASADPADVHLLSTDLAAAYTISWQRLPGRLDPIRVALTSSNATIPNIGLLAA
jgi:hypothetical protein